MTLRSFGGHHGLRGHQNGNIHIHTRVIEVADIKSDVKIGLLTIAARSSIGPLPSCFTCARSDRFRQDRCSLRHCFLSGTDTKSTQKNFVQFYFGRGLSESTFI